VRGPTLAVIAKQPRPGSVKTRLTPPLTPAEAAGVAEASLRDVLAAMALAQRPSRRVLLLDGAPDPWLEPGFDVVAQRGAGLDERLANGLADLGGPLLIVGMDTPQVTPELLDDALHRLARPDVDAVLAPAMDGGYWAIGLQEVCPAALLGVPMSSSRTCSAQLRRLRALGLRVALAPTLRDVDTFADLEPVAALAPASRFASAVRALRTPKAA
jgi:rSAM/selenodomain-associated transferase 1